MRDLRSKLDAALKTIEGYFDNRIHVSEATYTLYDPQFGYNERNYHFVRPKKLVFDTAYSYRAKRPEYSSRLIVSNTAHELFHLARFVLPRDGSATTSVTRGMSGDEMAFLFQLCVVKDVFGDVSFPKQSQVLNPALLKSEPAIRGSASGAISALELVKTIAGKDNSIDTDVERTKFNQICHAITR